MNRADRTRRAIRDQHRHAIRGPHDSATSACSDTAHRRRAVSRRQVLAHTRRRRAVNLIERHETTDGHADGNGKRLPRGARGNSSCRVVNRCCAIGSSCRQRSAAPHDSSSSRSSAGPQGASCRIRRRMEIIGVGLDATEIARIAK
jgi:hypothetical protein